MARVESRIGENLQRIQDRIVDACARSGREAGAVRLIAVTKTAEIDDIRALIDLGVRDLGESRAPQLSQRAGETAQYAEANGLEPARWHMIGHLQRNKVKPVLSAGALIHSVDSLRLAEEINARAEKAGLAAEVLLQVNCSQEPQKHGVAVGAAVYLGELVSTMKHVRLAGLMTMAPLDENPEAARPTFIRLREIFDEMRHEGIGGTDFQHLSMGMSQDYAVAVEEGATMVRVGTALFE